MMRSIPKVLCFLAASAYLNPAHAAPFRSEKGYSLQAPAGWKLTRGFMSSDAAFAAPARNGFAANINVVVTPLPPGATLAQAKAQTATMLAQTFSGFKLLGQRNVSIAGGRGLKTEATFRTGTPPRNLRLLQVVTVHNNRAYFFTATALTASYSAYQGAFQRALDSVKLTK